MRAVDTNVLLRLIVGDDAEQVKTAEEFVANGCWVPMLALAEAIWVLRSAYNHNAAQIGAVVRMLLENKDLVLQESDVIAAALAAFQSHPGLGFADCLMLESARKSGNLPLGTFDRRLGALDGAQRL